MGQPSGHGQEAAGRVSLLGLRRGQVRDCCPSFQFELLSLRPLWAPVGRREHTGMAEFGWWVSGVQWEWEMRVNGCGWGCRLKR